MSNTAPSYKIEWKKDREGSPRNPAVCVGRQNAIDFLSLFLGTYEIPVITKDNVPLGGEELSELILEAAMHTMVTIVAERFDISKDEAGKIVGEFIARKAFDIFKLVGAKSLQDLRKLKS
jgi:hypothetical protein